MSRGHKNLITQRQSRRGEMTQKGNLFKGQQKKRTIPPNRHRKIPYNRKGKRVVKPSKMTTDSDSDRELTKFINHCNEIKAATVATKDGGQLSIVKVPPPEPSKTAKEE